VVIFGTLEFGAWSSELCGNCMIEIGIAIVDCGQKCGVHVVFSKNQFGAFPFLNLTLAVPCVAAGGKYSSEPSSDSDSFFQTPTDLHYS
jgi:hypothetical protein